MSDRPTSAGGVRLAVPFFGVEDIARSARWYTEGLGFTQTRQWTPEGRLRWCWLELDDVAVMLQEYTTTESGPRPMIANPGQGVTISFQCDDALAVYHAAQANGLEPSRPFVGNGMWVTALHDPDGYRLEFESVTDVAEGTEYEG